MLVWLVAPGNQLDDSGIIGRLFNKKGLIAIIGILFPNPLKIRKSQGEIVHRQFLFNGLLFCSRTVFGWNGNRFLGRAEKMGCLE